MGEGGAGAACGLGRAGEGRRERAWRVLLLGGASGVGKTCVSYPLAAHYGVGICEADDLHLMAERMTTPAQQPVLHFWRQHPDAIRAMDDDQRLDYMLRLSQSMSAGFAAVIANHVANGPPVVMEGDYLLPALAVEGGFADSVRAVILFEEAEEQIARNFLAREGRPQAARARASWRYSEWLRREASRLDVPAVAARPWATVLQRVVAAVEARD